MPSILVPLLLLCAAAFSPRPAYADGINGSLEFTKSITDVSTKAGGAETNNSTADSFVQRYNLTLDRSLYPLVKVNAGGMFEKSLSDTTSNGTSIESEATRLSPYLNLLMGNPMISSAFGYNRNETTASSSGVSPSTNVLEIYNARLGLKPEDLPSLDLRFSRNNSFDKDRVSLDSTTDSYAVSSRYEPLQNLNLTYQGSLFTTKDNLNNLETRSISNAVTGSYARQLFANRVSIYTSGTLATRETALSSSGEGGVFFLSFFPLPVNGLSAVTPSAGPPPITAATGQLSDNLPLRDGTAQINIVTPVTDPLPPVGTEKNMGLDMGPVFTGQTALNTLFLTVTTVNSGTGTSPLAMVGSAIPARFSWNIYTSSNGIDWNLAQTIPNAPFVRHPFATGSDIVGFRLDLSIAAARFIKVAVAPPRLNDIPPLEGVNLSSILVTRIEALERRSVAGSAEQKTSSQSGLLNMGGRVKLLDRPSLPSINYDVNFNYNINRQDVRTTSTWYLSNGLSAYHIFNRRLSGSARLSREDSEAVEGHRTGYSYNASLEVRPLSTLTHSVIYSGRLESSGGKNSNSNSLFLRNSATLYRGVSVNLDGGVSLATNTEGVDSQSVVVTSGASIIPHPTVSLNVSITETRSEQSGGGRAASSGFTRTGGVSVSYTPFSSVSLFASVGFSAQTGRESDVTQNFGGSWSPFRDGALLFSIFYNESLSSTGDQKTRVLAPSLRWNIRSGWWLDLSYSLLTTEQTAAGLTGETEQSTISSALRLSF